jgi:hypothetical protein
MVSDRVTRELRAALDSLRGERDQLDRQIGAMENLLAQMGAPLKRGPGRPPGTGMKRGPGRPPGTGMKRGPGRPPGSGVKRGPGRPPKSETMSAGAAGATPVKRGPGRPKGSKNKAPAAAKAGGAKRRSPKWSAEAREAARNRMKAYWAARKKGSK